MNKFKLNLLRKFDNDKERRDYFTFPNKDINGNSSTYSMNDKQMKEFETSIIRKIVKNVFHYI
jgi:hypothetical protein